MDADFSKRIPKSAELIVKGVCAMSNESKMTEIKLNGWYILALAAGVFFFWEPLLIIGGILLGSWLIYRNREKIQNFLDGIAGKN